MRLSAEGRRVLAETLLEHMRDAAAMQSLLDEVDQRVARYRPNGDVTVRVSPSDSMDSRVKLVTISPALFEQDP